MMYRSVVLLASLVAATTAFAQQKPSSTPPAPPPPPASSAAAPISAEPTSTTASFGDWVLRCQKIEAVRACEVGQSITVQGQSGPIAQLAIGRPAPKEKLRLTIVLPNNVTLTAPVRLGTGEKVDQGLSLAWRRCLTVGCFADNELPDDQLRRYRMTSEPGRLVFQDGAGRELALPFSFNGLAQALDALARES
jgi:invasion protein IalB